jgi:hypothetical protein
MFKVYWTDIFGIHGEDFSDLTQALNYTQYLRNEGNKHVVLSSENPDNVTKMGVAEAGPDYSWKKRRI